ncbi:MAG: DoxX family membrane protein, partial [Acidimicrobiales bacterium]
MRIHLKPRTLPGRLSTGAFILHSGLEKWNGDGDDARAEAIHGMASNTFPMLKNIPPKQFLKLLAAGELAVGGALLTPVVSEATAGLALCGFSGALLVMYWRTEGMHKE